MEDAGECIMDMNFLLRRLATLYYFLIRLFWATLCGLKYPQYPPQRMQKLREAMSRGPISHRSVIIIVACSMLYSFTIEEGFLKIL